MRKIVGWSYDPGKYCGMTLKNSVMTLKKLWNELVVVDKIVGLYVWRLWPKKNYNAMTLSEYAWVLVTLIAIHYETLVDNAKLIFFLYLNAFAI